jgi:hypothetical protein
MTFIPTHPMSLVADFLLWPVAVFLQAVCGVLGPAKTPRIALYQRIARLALLGSVVVFGTMIPLTLIGKSVIAIKPPLALGVVLLFVFVVIGNLCDDQSEDKDAEHGLPRARS